MGADLAWLDLLISHLSGSTSKIEVLCVFGDNADRGCREYEFINQFCDCFVDNINNIGCTAIGIQGQWCGIRIYGPLHGVLIIMMLHNI